MKDDNARSEYLSGVAGTVGDRDVAEEPPGMGSRRVPAAPDRYSDRRRALPSYHRKCFCQPKKTGHKGRLFYSRSGNNNQAAA